MMKKTQPVKDREFTLRKCVSNQRISMEIIPQFSPQPYFVRKQQQQNKLQRVSSLTPRKNKLIEIRKYQSSKQKLQNPPKKSQIQLNEQSKTRKFNSPLKIQNIFTHNYRSEREINTINFQQKPQNGSQQNFSDEKLSSSKSVRFSNRIDDNLSINSKRQGSRTPSILKNKNRKYGTGLTSIPSQRSFSVNNSFHSNHKEMKKKIQEESNANNIVKKKYESILKALQMKDSKNKPPLPGRKYLIKGQQASMKIKFQDDIFPPVYSSIFPPNPKNNKVSSLLNGKQIQWKRISEIFPNKKLILYDRPEAVPKYFDSTKQQSEVMKIRITKQKNSYASQFLVTALNSIKNNEDLLYKMFQNQQINEYGIYLVKIFQQNTWKYIIIDDFIPVIRSSAIDSLSPYMPAFINIKPQLDQKDIKNKRKNIGQKSISIWPFLLQKAYANYYSSYEALTHGQVLDMVSQFCGISYQKISLVQKTDPQEYLEVIDKLLLGLKNGNVVVLAQLKDELPMIPLHYKAEFCYSMITEQELFYYDPHQEYKPSKIKFYDLGLICTHLFLFTPVKYLHQMSCTISKPKHKVSPNLITKINKENIFHRDIPTIRKFILKSTCQCSLFIRQKEKRFLHRLGVEYIWLRAILIGKQYDGSYRWIDGQYSNKKGISFNHLLDSGEYFIFLYPQWGKEKYNHEIHVSLYCNEQVQNFERIQFDSKQRMLQQACTDLAQKSGKLRQINRYICSYNFVDKKSALIIENIVNQRLHGEVNIVRSINGLKSQVDIVPVNDEFYEDLKQKYQEEGADYLAVKKTTIDVKIKKSQSYSVILKMKGKIDSNFFRVFTFGS